MTTNPFSNELRVRACALIVQDSSVLLAKTLSPTRENPVWLPPGGGVEYSESLEVALRREVNEETGLQIEMKQLLWIHEYIEDPIHAIEFYFKCEITGGKLKMGIDPELESDQQILIDLAFIPFEEAGELAVEPKFIKEFCEKGGQFFDEVRHVISKEFSL